MGTKFQVGDSGRKRKFDIYTDEGFLALSNLWTRSNWQHKLSYETTWLGIPIIQLPEDLLMMQEVIYKVRPEVIIETGTAHGGTAVFYASMLELLGKGRVISIDNEIRKYNRLAIQAHPMSKRITLVEGDSVDDTTVSKVKGLLRPRERVLVALDSNHTYAHVSKELEKYSPMVSPESYIIVFDGVMKMVADAPNGKPKWRRDNPGTAVEEFVSKHGEFEPDYYYNRMAVTYCPRGFLRRKPVEEG